MFIQTQIFRGNKVSNAANYGCSGAVLFSDPADVAPNGPEGVYPDGVFLPGTGMQVRKGFKSSRAL